MKNTGTIWPKVRSEEIVVWNFVEAFSHQRLSRIKASEFLRILVRLHSKIPHIPLYLLSKAALKTHHGLKFKLQKEDRSVALTIVTLKGSGKNLSLLFYFLVALYVAQFTTLISASVFTWLFFPYLFSVQRRISALNVGSVNSFSVSLIKYHDQANLYNMSVWLKTPEGKESIIAGTHGIKWQAWQQEQEIIIVWAGSGKNYKTSKPSSVTYVLQQGCTSYTSASSATNRETSAPFGEHSHSNHHAGPPKSWMILRWDTLLITFANF